MKIQPEQYAMMTIFDWVRLNKLDKIIWHTANERRCSISYGAMLKRMGVLPGVADITISRATNGYHGAYIELKMGANKATPTQIEFLNTMNEEGYYTKVVYGVEQAIYAIMEYLFHQGTPSSSVS